MSEPDSITARAFQWLNGHDKGSSSIAIWAHMMANPAVSITFGGSGYPHDPSDFGRCERLLDAFPEWRSRLPEMAAYSPIWERLVARWGDIKARYDEAVACGRSEARACYELIKECGA